jgi:dTDP-4-amino-4,6-dideoxygalactose transaminase
MRSTFLPYNRPDLTEAEAEAVADAVRSLWITRGPRVTAFEAALADYLGVEHVVAVRSCTAALHLALVAEGVGPGDEVVTTPLTFVSSVNVIVQVGATPVLADVDPATGLLDPGAVDAVLTPRTRGVLPVDYAGHPVDLDGFRALAARRGLFVLEDAAHAIGAAYRDRPVGQGGHWVAFSFYATKNLTTGEGGALVCPSAAAAERVRVLSLHGLSQNAWARYTEGGSWYYEVHQPGFKYNMTDIDAALGLVQLRRLDAMQARRAAIAARYQEAFMAEPALEIPHVRPGVRPAWHLYPLRIRPERLDCDRDTFVEELRRRRIGTSVHFIPIHYHPYYRERFGWRKGAFPHAEDYFAREISLPLYPTLSDADVEDVVAAVLDVAARHAR